MSKPARTAGSEKVDAYIAGAEAFARPILNHFRKLVHRTIPDVEERTKWNMPHFVVAGSAICYMGAFKHHVAIGFMGAPVMHDPYGHLENDAAGRTAMGQLGRLTKRGDLPDDEALRYYILESARLILDGQRRKRVRIRRTEADVPPDLEAALRRNADARHTFDAFTPSQRREYVNWILDARRDDTRERRLIQAIEWMAEGKPRDWKYQR